MRELIKSKAKGLKDALVKFSRKIGDFKPDNVNINRFTDLISEEMKELSFDKVTKDKAGNLIGVIKGYSDKNSIIMISHIDNMVSSKQKLKSPYESDSIGFKSGIISSVYAGALVKRTMLPLTGDLIVCCVPRFECCDYGIKYLFGNFSKAKLRRIKGVILCEPTDFNINLGHKGRMEYEIVVKGKLRRDFLENRGVNVLSAMFPLINELEKASKELPSDFNLGRSNLRIKDVRYGECQSQDEGDEFRIVVDRMFIPEENEHSIFNKAKTITKNVYKNQGDVTVNTILAKERIRTYTGLNLIAKKEFKPWIMESHNPFVLESLNCLVENGFKSKIGYWKKIITEGSFTYAQLKIPTIGFGAGSEDAVDLDINLLNVNKLEKAVYGLALIIQRNIGMPTFGWSPGEI